MIVVHQSSTYDARFSTKRGVDEAVSFAKGAGIPVIYLQDDSPDEFYFMADCDPTYWVFSQGGEITFDVTPRMYTSSAATWSCACPPRLNAILTQWSRRAPAQPTGHLPDGCDLLERKDDRPVRSVLRRLLALPGCRHLWPARRRTLAQAEPAGDDGHHRQGREPTRIHQTDPAALGHDLAADPIASQCN